LAELCSRPGSRPIPRQKLSIKVEIDTRPPAGAKTAVRIGGLPFPLAYRAHDLPSLFAGKLCALLCRRYTKGRDFFDLGWYLSRWPDLSPNFELLRNGLRQAGAKEPFPSEADWRNRIAGVVEQADWAEVRRDAAPFLERPADLEIFTRENILRMLNG